MCSNLVVSPDDWHHLLGANSWLGDGLSGRCRLLPCLQCHRVGGQRGKRSSLHAAAGTNDAAEHPGNQEPPWDPQWPREHIRIHADCSWRSHYRLGHQGGTSRNVRLTTTAALKAFFCPFSSSSRFVADDEPLFCSKDARLPVQLQRAMAAEAEAAREARAKAMRHFSPPSTLSLSHWLFTVSGYCCRGRTKSLKSAQRGLRGHFRIILRSPTPLLAGWQKHTLVLDN